jgi:cytoskeletal protein RodZ
LLFIIEILKIIYIAHLLPKILMLTFFRTFNASNLRPVSMFLPGQSATPVRSVSSPTQSIDITSPQSTADSSVSLKSELGELDSPDKKAKLHRVSTCDKEQITDTVEVKECSTGMSQYQLSVGMMTTSVSRHIHSVNSWEWFLM